MMKKTTSALAIAALLGTGAATAATFQVNDDTTINVGGDFQMAYTSTTGSTGEDTVKFGDNASSLVFSGSHDAGNGLTTFFNLDFDGFDTTEAGSTTTNSLTNDEANVGIRGSFGEVVVGSNGGAFDSYADYGDVAQTDGMTGVSTGDSSDVVQYSNAMGGVDFTIQAEIGDDEGDTADNTSSTSLAAGFSADLGGVSLSAAYDQRANTATDEPVYGIGATANVGGIDVTVGYQKDDNNTNSLDLTTLVASYSVGQVDLVGAIQNTSYDNVVSGQDDDAFTEFYAGVIYNVTSQMYVYGEMLAKDQANDEGDNMAVGVYYGW